MSFSDDLQKNQQVTFHSQIDLSPYTTFRLSSMGDLIIVKTIEGLRDVLAILKKYHRSYRMIGWGANQVLAPIEKDVLIKLDFALATDYLSTEKNEYDLPASVSLSALVSHAMKFGLKGWEALTGIPASLGGAIYMNAGTALGEIAPLVRSVQIMNQDGVTRTETISGSSFSYRKNAFVGPGDIILSAKLVHHGVDAAISKKIQEYLEYRKRTQPLATKNCGCVFKNFTPALQAGRLIDLVGLKGLCFKELKVSHKHSNFIEHSGGSTAEDFQDLVKIINLQTKLHLGVTFELEVKV